MTSRPVGQEGHCFLVVHTGLVTRASFKLCRLRMHMKLAMWLAHWGSDAGFAD